MPVRLFFLQQAHTRCHQTNPYTAAEKAGFKKAGRQQTDTNPGQPDPKQLIFSAHWQHLPGKCMRKHCRTYPSKQKCATLRRVAH